MRGNFKWYPGERQARPGRPGMPQLSGTKWEFALNTERQLNVKTATVHEEVNKVNSPLLHFELIDRGNNLLYHSLVSLLKSWPWNRWSDEGELETRELAKHRNKLKTVQLWLQTIKIKQGKKTACTYVDSAIWEGKNLYNVMTHSKVLLYLGRKNLVVLQGLHSIDLNPTVEIIQSEITGLVYHSSQSWERLKGGREICRHSHTFASKCMLFKYTMCSSVCEHRCVRAFVWLPSLLPEGWFKQGED